MQSDNNSEKYLLLTRRKAITAVCVVFVLMVALQLAWHMYPRSRQEIIDCQAILEQRHVEKVMIGNESFYTLCDTVVKYPSVWVNRYRLIPSCEGRLVADMAGEKKWEIAEKGGKTIFAELKTLFERTVKNLRSEENELKYYLRTHGVQDEGYEIAVVREAEIAEKLQRYSALLDSLMVMGDGAKYSVSHANYYSVAYRNRYGRVVKESCRPLNIVDGARKMFQTTTKSKPLGKRPRYYRLSEIVSPTPSLTDSLNRTIVNLSRKCVGRVFLPSVISDISFDNHGRKIVGQYVEDTLNYGYRRDSLGYYVGQFNKEGAANGHGVYRTKTGEYYEGRWENDYRSGFGFECGNNKYVKSGEWAAGVFKGERLNYTSERIYGIDIARYQHEVGRKIYPIDWDNLRINHLGNISKKRISGAVDYPVSFIYIKSTEGTTVLNRYYSSDYVAAKQHGKRVGTYHFFSTKSSGRAQAEYFLKCSKLQKGDMPPVLDVEPSHAQIVAMGGVDVMFRHIRDWMNVVENATGCRPVLYVSQSFVNRYLNDAPDIKSKYNVWIARYGEYKPDVHLVYWQLSPDGRVNGIHGNVDINVFNGYSDTFKDFLRESLIP